jgi:hypothetical protein
MYPAVRIKKSVKGGGKRDTNDRKNEAPIEISMRRPPPIATPSSKGLAIQKGRKVVIPQARLTASSKVPMIEMPVHNIPRMLKKPNVARAFMIWVKFVCRISTEPGIFAWKN